MDLLAEEGLREKVNTEDTDKGLSVFSVFAFLSYVIDHTQKAWLWLTP
jgi:hypothetical protein